MAVNYAMLIIGRLICGISGGIGAAVVPIYIGEITSKEIRGRCGKPKKEFLGIKFFNDKFTNFSFTAQSHFFIYIYLCICRDFAPHFTYL